jgi:hypothetical protein
MRFIIPKNNNLMKIRLRHNAWREPRVDHPTSGEEAPGLLLILDPSACHAM